MNEGGSGDGDIEKVSRSKSATDRGVTDGAAHKSSASSSLPNGTADIKGIGKYISIYTKTILHKSSRFVNGGSGPSHGVNGDRTSKEMGKAIYFPTN